MTYNLEIEKVQNGYKIQNWDDEREETRTVVFEYVDEDDDTKMEQLTMKKVLYYMMDYFAVHNDKHANNGEGQFIEIKVSGDEE